MFMCDRNPFTVSLKTPSDSAVRVPMLVRMDVQSFSMHFISAMGLLFVGLWGFVLLGL